VLQVRRGSSKVTSEQGERKETGKKKDSMTLMENLHVVVRAFHQASDIVTSASREESPSAMPCPSIEVNDSSITAGLDEMI